MWPERSCADLRAITTVKLPVRRECEDWMKIGERWEHLRTEVGVQCFGPDVSARRRGYELLAEAFDRVTLMRASGTQAVSDQAVSSREVLP